MGTQGVKRTATSPDWGSLRRVTPISNDFGLDRGRPVDRYYIENFLDANRRDIRGRVLEILSDDYTKRFGAGVTRSDVLHPVPGNPNASIVGDLGTGVGVPKDQFDCIICTQTLHLIYDLRTAVLTLRNALAPGGVLLATLPTITQVSRYDADRWGDYWRLTSLAARRLFGEFFEDLQVTSFGNVLSATAFLQGITVSELTAAELDHVDRDYEMIVCVRGVRKSERQPS